MTKIIDGKATSAAIKQEIAEQTAQMVAAGKAAPHLVAILVGHDGGSETYVANKVKACEACGFTSSVVRMDDTVTHKNCLPKWHASTPTTASTASSCSFPCPATSTNRP